MNKKNLDIAYFLSFCIEQYKTAKELTGKQVVDIFEKYEVMEYLEHHYEVLHTQSRQWLLEDIDEFINIRKEKFAWNFICIAIYWRKGGHEMNLDVTQENLYLFLPSKISWMADMLASDKKISIADAVKEIYKSETYRKLENDATKLWHLGPVALYQEFID